MPTYSKMNLKFFKAFQKVLKLKTIFSFKNFAEKYFDKLILPQLPHPPQYKPGYGPGQ